MRTNNKNPIPKSTGVQAVSRALEILICLGKEIHSIADIAKYCKLSKSTVHRLLKTLEQSYFVQQDPINQQYYLGPLINQLALESQISSKYLIYCCLQEMDRLAKIFNETIDLDVFIGHQEVLVHRIVSTSELRVIGSGGGKKVQYTGATSRTLLSQLDDEELKVLIGYTKITAETENTITDKEVLIEQIRQTRRQGYCVSIGERLVGAMSIAVPIMNYVYPAALTVLGPENRIKPKMEYFLKEFIKSANRISKSILESNELGAQKFKNPGHPK
jgi:DNA-binding IclR family transcriptional regulator